MKKVAVYFNEHSSKSDFRAWKSMLADSLFRYNVTFKTPADLNMFALEIRKDIKNHTDIIIGIGGDGTANVMAQQLTGLRIKIFFIPAGTANDLCNQLKIRGNEDDLIDILKTEFTTKIDVIKINDSKMLTNGGLGLPNQVAKRINKYRNTVPGFKKLMKHLGGKIYLFAFIVELIFFRYKKYSFLVRSSNHPAGVLKIKAPMILINNQPVFGNCFRIAPDTQNTDGKFNVSIFKDKTKLSFLKTVFKVQVLGVNPNLIENVISFETAKIEIESKEHLEFFGDGEQLISAKKFTIEIIPQGLELISKGLPTKEIPLTSIYL